MNFDLLVEKLTDDVVSKIIELFKQGKSLVEIEKELGISQNTILKYLKQAASKGLIDYTSKDISPLTEEEIAKIIELFKQGKSLVEIAKELGISQLTVIRQLKKAASKGLIDYTPKDISPLTEEEIAKIIELFKQGKSLKEISKELGIGQSTVTEVMKSLDTDTLDDIGIFLKKTNKTNRITRLLGSFKDYFNKEEESKEKLNDDEYDKKPKKFDRQMMISILKSTAQNKKYFVNKRILRIMSLPHNYLAEKDLLKELNPGKIESFGFNIPKFKDAQIQYGIDVYEETKGRIEPYLLIKDANRAILDQDKIVFKKITPHKTYGYGLIKPITPEFNSFDIIDLDYKGIPGSANMTVGNNNPWLPPIVAAKKYLKRNGVVMITYLGDTWRKHKAGEHMIQGMLSREGSVLKKYEDYMTPDSNFYINPDKPNSNMIRSLAKRKNKEETVKKHYAVAAKAGNLYTKNILKLAEEQGVKLKVIHLNIYPGGATSFMYRIALQKID
jgi:Mn-dependent DtxR family transcriptional regulator